MTTVRIDFSADEWYAAYSAGEARHRHHCERKRRVVQPGGLAQEGIGVVAEVAVARYLGGKANTAVGREHYGGADVVDACGNTVEVKATDWRNGRLLIYSDTPDDLPVILVVVDVAARSAALIGWLPAKEGKRPEWWEAKFKTPCWAVRQEYLRPMEDLPCSPPSSLAS